MPDRLWHILYRSTARYSPDDPSTLAIVQEAERRNPRLGVTGLLYREDWRFYQYIEGPRAGLETLFAGIRRDERHFHVVVLSAGAVPIRFYETWAMLWIRHDRGVGRPGRMEAPIADGLETAALHGFLLGLAQSHRPALPSA
jgi:hypothetical protein